MVIVKAAISHMPRKRVACQHVLKSRTQERERERERERENVVGCLAHIRRQCIMGARLIAGIQLRQPCLAYFCMFYCSTDGLV